MVSEDTWNKFEYIRQSGITNMFDVRNVVYLSKLFFDEPLTRNDCFRLIDGDYEIGMQKVGKAVMRDEKETINRQR